MVQISAGANLSPDQTFGSIRSLSVSREVASFPLSRTPTPPPQRRPTSSLPASISTEEPAVPESAAKESGPAEIRLLAPSHRHGDPERRRPRRRRRAPASPSASRCRTSQSGDGSPRCDYFQAYKCASPIPDYGFGQSGYPSHQQPPQQQQQQQPPTTNWFDGGGGGGGHYPSQPRPQPQAPFHPFPASFNTSIPSSIDQSKRCTCCGTPILILPTSNGACQQPLLPAPTCIPYPMPMPIFQPYDPNCKCGIKSHQNLSARSFDDRDRESTHHQNSLRFEANCESGADHRCQEGSDGTVCVKKNCPTVIQLQAMIAQLLGIQGIIASAITRILLKRIPGSNLPESIEGIMERASRCLKHLSKQQLLRESKCSQEINGLLSLYMTSSVTLPRVIPILTSAQLKSNVLKAMVEAQINAHVMEDQGCGAEAPEPLDTLILELKSNDEVRQLLAALRERECEERMNLSFAAFGSQRAIAQTRLANVQMKIEQVQREIEKRSAAPSGEQTWQIRTDLYWSKSDCRPLFYPSNAFNVRQQYFESPDPFLDIRVSNPKKLLLKPHVGSPETTYCFPDTMTKVTSFGSNNDKEDGRKHVRISISEEKKSETPNATQTKVTAADENLQAVKK